MRIKCKIIPNINVCCNCIDYQIDNRKNLDCSVCEEANKDYEILSFSHTFFGMDYALVLANDMIKKIPLNRLREIRIID